MVRKHPGYGHIPGRHASPVNDFTLGVLSPCLNFHRPCFFPEEAVDAKGRATRRYRCEHLMTPYEKLKSPPGAEAILSAPACSAALKTRWARAQMFLAEPARRHRRLRRRAGPPGAPGPQPQGLGGGGHFQPPPVGGGKLRPALNYPGQITGWAWATANARDTWFHPLVGAFADRCVMLADTGFHAAAGDPPDLKICQRGQWNDRMVVETALSMTTVVPHTPRR